MEFQDAGTTAHAYDKNLLDSAHISYFFDALKKVFTKNNMVFFLCFLIVYYCLYYILGKHEGPNAVLHTKYAIDFFILIVVLLGTIVYYLYIPSIDKQHLITYGLEQSVLFFEDPTSFFTTMILILLFYLTIFVCDIPMTAETKPITVSLIEQKLYIVLIMVMFVNLFQFAFGLNIPHAVIGTIEDIWEKIYNVSTNGKLIPMLTKKEVMKVAAEIANPNDTISAYLPQEEADLFIIINKYGHVFVKAVGKTPLSYEQWNRILFLHLNTYLTSINDITQQAGYVMKLFEDMRDERMTKINYTLSLPVEDRIQLAQRIPCITEMFDIYNDDVSNDHAIYLKYKRTEHFVTKEGQRNLIRFIQEHHTVHARTVAIASLRLNYALSLEESERVFDAYEGEESKEIVGQPIDSGFPIHMTLSDNQLTITVEHITAVDYVHELFIYLDGIVRLTQQSLAHTSSLSYEDMCTGGKALKEREEPKTVVNIPSVLILPFFWYLK